jgi:hypothetical protein
MDNPTVLLGFYVQRYLDGFETASTADEIDDVLSVIDFDLDHDLSFLRYR